ncbi:MAG: asparagine synthase B [Pseudomonadota bacterium]
MCGIFAFHGLSADPKTLQAGSEKLSRRGPDHSTFQKVSEGVYFGFHRLAIMDTSFHGNQPFKNAAGDSLICNGEIYNFESLKREYLSSLKFDSHSDCEVLLPLIKSLGLMPAAKLLDAEFALVYWDAAGGKLYAARDPLGIRPLFVGYTKVPGEIAFASEVKALQDFCQKIIPFPPGHIFDGSQFVPFRHMTRSKTKSQTRAEAATGIRESLTEGVIKRLHADRTLGCLLSGGLDSSLVAAIAAKHQKFPLKTFAIGTHNDPIDLKYAAIVAKHIGSQHQEILFDPQDAVSALEEVIAAIESYDTTSVRASLGMYLICKEIRRTTDVKVLLTGEVSDELFGYKYTDFAPSPEEFQKEAVKRIDEIHYFDVLRADRCISSNGLEARVPFGDLDFVERVMAIDPLEKMNRNGMGKSLLREAFAGTDLLPDSILYREKSAFSDAVGHSMVDGLKAYAEAVISSSDLENASKTYPINTPRTKEALLYRNIFEAFYPGRSDLIIGYWMPNPNWEGCNVQDPSARVLSNYGKSGS